MIWLSKIIQSWGFLYRIVNPKNEIFKIVNGLASLLTSMAKEWTNMRFTAGLPLTETLLTPVAKNVLLPFGLSAWMSAADAAIKKNQKHHGSGTTALIVSNKEMEDIRKIVKSPEESGLQMKRISETIENEIKE